MLLADGLWVIMEGRDDRDVVRSSAQTWGMCRKRWSTRGDVPQEDFRTSFGRSIRLITSEEVSA